MVWPTPYDVKLDEFDSKILPGQQLESAFAANPLDHIVKLDVWEPPGCQRMTNIMASIGRSSNTVEVVEQLMAAGMNIALFNLFYASMEENMELIKMVQNAAKNYSKSVGRMYPLGIAICLSGRKIRTGKVSNVYRSEIEIESDTVIKLTTDESFRYKCSPKIIFIDFPNFVKEIEGDDLIEIDNHKIVLKVESVGFCANCRVLKGGTLASFKDVIIPFAKFDMPNFTERDIQYISMIDKLKVDIVIASCVCDEVCIEELRNLIGEKQNKICIIADIETAQGFHNYDRILEVSDGVMLTRQQLGTVLTNRNMIFAQKNMMARANKANVSAFISAQFLTSMKYLKRAVNLELLDISNCIVEGADGLVLSSETSVGLHPVESMRQMALTCKEAEQCLWTRALIKDLLDHIPIPVTPLEALALSAVRASHYMVAAAIVVLTQNLESVKVVSKFKPKCPIIAVTRYPRVARQLHLWRGIIPIVYEEMPNEDWQTDVENRATFAIKWAMLQGFVRMGDTYLILSSWMVSAKEICNMRIETAKC